MQKCRQRTSKEKLFLCSHSFPSLVTVLQRYDVYLGVSGLWVFPPNTLGMFLKSLFFLYLWHEDACTFFIVVLGSHLPSADAKLHLQHRGHILKISCVSYLRPGYEKISISCCWPLFIHRPLNTPAYELLGFKPTLSLIYGEIKFFVRLLLLRCFHWGIFL